MRILTFGSCLAAVALLSACSGGGSGSSPVPVHPQAGAGKASGALTLTYSRSTANKIAASSLRKPAYVSPGTQYVDVFINGENASGHVACGQNVITEHGGATPTPVPSPSGGATETCTVQWTAPGDVTVDGTTPQAFSVEIDDGAYALAEGAASHALSLGSGNDFTMTLDGVVASASLTDPSGGSHSEAVTIALGDADNYLIVPSSDPAEVFDNAPVATFTINSVHGNQTTSSSAPTISAGTPAASWDPAGWSPMPSGAPPQSSTTTLLAPDAVGNDYSVTITCGTQTGPGSDNTSTFTFSLATGASKGAVSAGNFSGLGLTLAGPGSALGNTMSGSCDKYGHITLNTAT